MDQYFNAVQESVRQNNEWSAQQAQKQMDFQREMSNTAHQREIADLKAAGLNPVLSAKLGGASTPNGAMASGDTSGTAAMVDLLQMAMETANSAAGAAKYAAGAASRGDGTPEENAAYWSEGDGYGSRSWMEKNFRFVPSKFKPLWSALMAIGDFASAHPGESADASAKLNGTYRSDKKAFVDGVFGDKIKALGSSAQQLFSNIAASAKDLTESVGKDLKRIYAPARQWSSVEYSGDGKSKGSSVWHAGGGSSKRVHTTR